MSVVTQLSSIFRDVFDDPALCVSDETSPIDIADWDSVAQVKLVLAVEEAFDMQFTSDEVTALHCFRDFVAVLSRFEVVRA